MEKIQLMTRKERKSRGELGRDLGETVLYVAGTKADD